MQRQLKRYVLDRRVPAPPSAPNAAFQVVLPRSRSGLSTHSGGASFDGRPAFAPAVNRTAVDHGTGRSRVLPGVWYRGGCANLALH